MYATLHVTAARRMSLFIVEMDTFTTVCQRVKPPFNWEDESDRLDLSILSNDKTV